MKDLVTYIKEQLKAEEAILTSIKADGLNRDQMISILSQNDMKTLKSISNILKTHHKENYFPYEPANDDFLNDKNKDDICGKIADAVMKLEK